MDSSKSWKFFAFETRNNNDNPKLTRIKNEDK